MNRRQFLKSLSLGVAALAAAPYLGLPKRKRLDGRIELIRELVRRGIEEHDRLIEEAIFRGRTPFGPIGEGSTG